MQTQIRRTVTALVVILVVSVGMMAVAPVANAVSGATQLCKNYGFGCTGAGYQGQPTWGYPVDSTGHNCTNYAAYRLSKNGAANPGNLGNAMDWDANARAKGFPVNGTPAKGSIAQWEPNSGHAGGYGHVAYVEEVASDHIVITEDNYGLGYTAKYKIMKGTAAWPSNFLHIKDLTSKPPPPPWHGVGDARFLGSDTLTAGQKMFTNQYILSTNGQHALFMQRDGNLVLYSRGRAVWASDTAGHPEASLVVQGDGNIVIYDGGGRMLWATNTERTDVNRLVMQSDGNIVARTASNRAEWASDTDGHLTYDGRGTNELRAGERLSIGQYIRSSDRRYVLLMQTDGNLVLYGPGYHVLWASNTAGHPEAYLGVQSDGNIVIYDGNRKPLWATNTGRAERLVVQNDGNLVAYGQGVARWASNTAGKI